MDLGGKFGGVNPLSKMKADLSQALNLLTEARKKEKKQKHLQLIDEGIETLSAILMETGLDYHPKGINKYGGIFEASENEIPKALNHVETAIALIDLIMINKKSSFRNQSIAENMFMFTWQQKLKILAEKMKSLMK